MRNGIFALTALLAGSLSTVSLSAGEFYRLNLTGLADGAPLVSTDASGKQISGRPTWGMWPRTAGGTGAEAVTIDGRKALKVNGGYQVNTSEWEVASIDAQQSEVYARFRFMIPANETRGISASFRLQQLNNRTAAFIAFEQSGGKFNVMAGQGLGDGRIDWHKVGTVEPGAWSTLDVKLDFSRKTFDVAVNQGDWATGKNFRHAAEWVGTMWAQDLSKKEYRYDIEAQAGAVIYVSDVIFSSDPIAEEN